jgi:hypothetical protein
MATGGVTDHDDSIEVDTLHREVSKVVDAGSDIVQCGRPPSVGLAQPTVFQIPDGEPARYQVTSDGVHLIAPIGHSPKAAVQEANHGRPWRRGKVQVRLVMNGRPVSDRLRH